MDAMTNEWTILKDETIQRMQNDRNCWKSFQEALLQSDLDVEVARQRAEQAEMRLEDARGMRLFNFPSPWPAATLFFPKAAAKGSFKKSVVIKDCLLRTVF